VQLGAVAQHLDARAVHAPDDGAAGPGAEVAAGDAGLAVQGFAQRGLAAAHEFVAFEHAGGGGHVAGAQLQAAGRDGHIGQAGRSVLRRCSDAPGQGHRQRHRAQARQAMGWGQWFAWGVQITGATAPRALCTQVDAHGLGWPQNTQ
jgi:hypothetical protein